VTATLITSEEAITNMAPLNEADCIIFGCPTYMGGPSAQFKQFIDAASKVWFVQGWKDKLAAGFTNSGTPSGDKLSTLNQLYINAMQHSMIWISTGIMHGAENTGGTDKHLNRLSCYSGAMSESPHGSKEPLAADLYTAERFGKRAAEIALRWMRGNQG
jgi:NAD(P)H dehydrogenase (quinone)